MNTIQDWISELKSSDKLIIVEGKKDFSALTNLGINNIKCISGPLYQFIESITVKNVIILTDLDSEGKKLYSVLKHNLQKRNVKIDNKFREFLFANSKITHIESLKNYNQEPYWSCKI